MYLKMLHKETAEITKKADERAAERIKAETVLAANILKKGPAKKSVNPTAVTKASATKKASKTTTTKKAPATPKYISTMTAEMVRGYRQLLSVSSTVSLSLICLSFVFLGQDSSKQGRRLYDGFIVLASRHPECNTNTYVFILFVPC